jgi:predicted unusual protein kinase regulating ubiquinone biosynthesis (AarF/ABC1/UbiB family)
MGLEHLVPFHWGLFKHPCRAQPYTRPEHVRMALEELGATSQHVDRARLREDLEHLVLRYYGHSLGAIALGPLLRETLVIARRHHLRLKTVMMDEGLGRAP